VIIDNGIFGCWLNRCGCQKVQFFHWKIL